MSDTVVAAPRRDPLVETFFRPATPGRPARPGAPVRPGSAGAPDPRGGDTPGEPGGDTAAVRRAVPADPRDDAASRSPRPADGTDPWPTPTAGTAAPVDPAAGGPSIRSERPAATDRASAAPVRAAGVRTRAGNAMARTRAALLDGAARAVAADGTAITMAQVALTAGVAKATLYNHFRTREAVLAALAETEVRHTAEEIVGLPVREALLEAAAAVVTHPVLATVRRRELGVLAVALTADPSSPALVAAREAVVALLTDPDAGLDLADPAPAADLVLRWLLSLALAPVDPVDALGAVDVLLAGLAGTRD